MEWCIPIQTFQVEKIQLGLIPNGLKPTVSLGYKDNDMVFPSLTLLLPLMRIKSYFPSTGKLVLSLDECPHVLRKFISLQDTITELVHSNQQRWFPNQPFIRKLSELKSSIQSMINNNEINLYCPINENDVHGPNIYYENNWSRGLLESGQLAQESMIRVVLKLQGVSFHMYKSTEQWSGKFRIQHRIISILVGSPPPN